jgi:hypothetical protein
MQKVITPTRRGKAVQKWLNFKAFMLKIPNHISAAIEQWDLSKYVWL